MVEYADMRAGVRYCAASLCAASSERRASTRGFASSECAAMRSKCGGVRVLSSAGWRAKHAHSASRAADEFGRKMYAPDCWSEHGGSRAEGGTSGPYSVQPPTYGEYTKVGV